MRQGKIRKIQKQITLSIKYSRLKLEIASLNSVLTGKRRLSQKNRNELQTHFEDATYFVSHIERNHRKKDYFLIENNTLASVIKTLDADKRAVFVLYNIAIDTILDASFPFTPNVLFFENVSLLLFESRHIFRDISERYTRLKAVMYGDEVKDSGQPLKRTGGKKSPLANIMKAFSFGRKAQKKTQPRPESSPLPSQNKVVINKTARENTKLTPFAFSSKLAERALYLHYASLSLGRVQFKEYARGVMMEVNAERQIIAKGLLEDWYDAPENSAKLRILTNYDNYVIAVIKEQLSN